MKLSSEGRARLKGEGYTEHDDRDEDFLPSYLRFEPSPAETLFFMSLPQRRGPD